MAAKALLFSVLLVQCIYGLFAAPFLPLAAEYPASFGCGSAPFGYANAPFSYNGLAFETPFLCPFASNAPFAYEGFAAPFGFGYSPFGYGFNGPFRYGAAAIL
ncbi:uncharacterized protein LOC121740069 [Aricia agestis]|uniref:uncharacterized protein LOC121740069 n=1 Tax=Aricia agestis TaxID=91739 RepID=UPI001C202AFF|nr:uncharacterized protein LOC121740069 [Aricia agestis]